MARDNSANALCTWSCDCSSSNFACDRFTATKLTSNSERSASGIGNQLAERDTLPDAVEQAGIGEKAGADACPRIGLRTGNIPRQRRKICRPGFVDPLVHGRRDVLRRQNLGVIFQRQRFGILQIQLRRGSGLRRKAAGYAPRQ